MKKFNENDLSIALIENSFDFIEKGLKAITGDDEKEYKYAVLHLFSGLLIFFKDMVFKEHWSLLFQSVDEANKEKFYSGDFKSVDFNTLIKRVQFIDRVKMTDELISDLEWMQKKRNIIEHLHSDLNPYEVKSRIASLLNHIILLIIAHRESDINYTVEDIFEHNYEYQAHYEMIRNYSFQFEDFIDRRIKIMKKELSQSDLLIRCPICDRETLGLKKDEDFIFCHFCLEKNTTELFFMKHSGVPLSHYYEGPVYNCPDCSSDLLYKIDQVSVCLSCLETFLTNEFNHCVNCAVTINTENRIRGLCDSCYDNIMSQ